jgi:cysteine synthase A
LDGVILGKCEQLNPGYSKKDRIAKQIIEDAMADGTLRPGQPVVELTSGNTGTGLAIVCGVTGNPFIAVMSEGNSMERARMMAALGAEVVLVPQRPGGVVGQVSGEDLALVEQRAQELVAERDAFRADQFHHRGNFRAHFLHTGPEIIQQAASAGLTIDGFVDFVGSGGTFGGVAAALQEHARAVEQDVPRCFIVEPTNAAVLAEEAGAVNQSGTGDHNIQGGGYSFRAPDLPLISNDGSTPGTAEVAGYLQVSDVEAMATARLLASSEGLFCGFSAGANVAAAAELLRGECRGGTVVAVLCDSGLKYLSTTLWGSEQ